MTAALYIYFAVYALFGASVVADDVKDGEPLWETLGDFFLYSLGLLGMILYLSGAADERLKTLWKFVSVALVAGQALLNFYSRRAMLRGEKGLTSEELTQTVILLADLGVIALLLPCLYMNVAYGYGPFS